MKSISISFNILETGQVAPVGCKRTSSHMAFDIKMDFTRKIRHMLNGCRNPSPESRMHSGIASRGSVRISFTCASLNSAYIWVCEIQNSYLQVPTTEKCYGVCSQEFGLENSGKVVIIRRAVCDRKVDSMEFRNNLRSCMEHIGFTACVDDLNI